MEAAHRPIILGQGLAQLSGLAVLAVHGADHVALFLVGHRAGKPAARGGDQGLERVEAKPHPRRQHGGFHHGTFEDAGQHHGGVAIEPGADVFHLLVRTPLGALDGLSEAEMVDQRLVVRVGVFRACAHHLLEPIIALRHGHVGIAAEVLDEDQLQVVVEAGQAPVDGAVDDVFLFRLPGVERVDGVDDIVAHHAGAPGCVFPVLLGQCAHGSAIPLARGRGCAAPVALAHMQDVVAVIAEIVVRCRGPFQVACAVMQEQVAPEGAIRSAQMGQCIQCKPVMVSPARRTSQHTHQHRHRTAPRIMAERLSRCG